MNRVSHIAWIAVLGLFMLETEAIAQSDPFEAIVKSSRVAVLPFANYAEVPAAMPAVMEMVRAELNRLDAELVTADAISETLRKYRVRNTNELSVERIQQLSDDLSVAYLLMGSLDRYVESEEGAEVALSARLVYVPTISIEWAAASAVHTADGIKVLELGTLRSPQRILKHAVAELFDDFGYQRPKRMKRVEAVCQGQDNIPCAQLLVLPFGNETSVHHAGSMVTQRVVAALFAEGFTVTDPGRMREAMLDNNDLTPGLATASLLKKCSEQTGADVVLTGTVSEYVGPTPLGFDTIPAVAVEARVIDGRTGALIWAKTLRCSGNDGAKFFGTGTTRSLGAVTDHLAAKLAKSIPVRKARRI